MKKTILITGGAGFMGSHLAEYFAKQGHTVFILDDLSGGYAENMPEGVAWFRGSICDSNLVDKIFKEEKFDYVFHLAAYAAEGLSHFIKRFICHNNIVGSINLINASINNDVKCFVFTSSMSVYGTNQVPMTEDLTPLPEDTYGIAKYAIERDLINCKDMFNMDYIIFRPHNLYGEKQNIWDKYRNVIGIFMNRVMKGEPIRIYGDGEQTRSFTYFSDVIPVIAESVFNKEMYNETFNIGADKVTTINELSKLVSKAMGIELKTVHLEQRYEVKHAYESQEKIKRLIGYKAIVPLEEGLKKMAEWAKKAGQRKAKDFEKFEVTKNLYSYWRKQK